MTTRHEYYTAWETRINPDGRATVVRLAACAPCKWVAESPVEDLPQRMAQYNTHKVTTDGRPE